MPPLVQVDPRSAFAATIFGAGGGVAANKLAPTVGRSPSLLKSRNSKNFGPNSKRLVGQEAISGAIGALGGVVTGSSK